MSVSTRTWPGEDFRRTVTGGRGAGPVPKLTRQRLLSSGQSLFASHGLHGVTTHDIARNAGVAAGTFYLHFKDKRELFRELALESVAGLRARLQEASERAPDAPGAVRARAEALMSFAASNRDLVRILFSPDADAAAVETDVLGALACDVEAEQRGRPGGGQVSRELDPAVLSQAVVGMWARVLAWWVEDPSRASSEAVVDTLTRIQLSGTRLH